MLLTSSTLSVLTGRPYGPADGRFDLEQGKFLSPYSSQRQSPSKWRFLASLRRPSNHYFCTHQNSSVGRRRICVDKLS